MSNLIKIIDKDLDIKEWRNERVVTIYDIAMLHDRKPNEVTKIFNRNISKFIENEHYFIISKKEFFERFKNFQNYIPNNVEENDRNFTRMKWTQKGREFIHNLLKEN